jgi:hypothetical protein
VTTRAEWQQLAEDRILDAQAHLAPGVGRWSAAYYLVGYAVECGLKSCIVARVAAQPGLIYEERKFAQELWTHDFETLVRLAGLETDRDRDAAANPARSGYWKIVKKWNEQARYLQKTQAEAELLFEAVVHPINGVMQWIRTHW